MRVQTFFAAMDAIPDRIAAFARKSLTILAERRPFYPISMIRSGVGSIDAERGLAANVVMACVFWLQRTFTEAELVVQRRVSASIWEPVEDHALSLLIATPNDVYDGDALWKATVLSYSMAGNGYWWKIRNAFGEVIQLWYIPHWMIRPESALDGTSRRVIDYYVVTMGIKGPLYLSPNDVVHFRFGLDPNDTRLGLDPLRCLMREIETDMQATEFAGHTLGNFGMPGFIVSPKDNAAPPTPAQIAELKEYLTTGFNGTNSGKAAVLGRATEIHEMGRGPNEVGLPNLRDISEERVCAVMGVPAAVVGFGTGLQSTKVGATMREMVKLAWVGAITPMQHTFARTITAQLLPDFQSQTRRFRARFDVSEAAAFVEEFQARATTTAMLVEKGILRVDRAQKELGLEVDTSRAVYLGPPEPVDPTDPTTDPTADPTANGDVQSMLQGMAARLPPRLRAGLPTNGNGNGNGTR